MPLRISPGLLFGPQCDLGRSRGGCTLQQKWGDDLFQRRAKTEGSSTDIYQDGDKDISRATLIWRAIKLPIYSVALIPLTVSNS